MNGKQSTMRTPGLADRVRAVLARRRRPPDPRCLLRVADPTSTALRATPVLPVEDGGRRWLVADSPTADWVGTARASRWAILSRGRRAELVELVERDPHRPGPPVFEIVGGPIAPGGGR